MAFSSTGAFFNTLCISIWIAQHDPIRDATATLRASSAPKSGIKSHCQMRG
jgi:hypothetical protein